ncbi:response regulator transcription factor [Nocardia cyriacigeorgica]|uniref:response regulator n=1 Tax=Nocardia cyriacigeorgica TaxID=135487 RepID=UPI000CE9AF81|nr:response regulator transcription factor [Nocardia cyriacigeorgica]AVH22804.1 DNA-binding response regulator [Nocardia cyriacigeorgica]MBF6089486.1 response regulator transcription factor [Nocardia cyriacigeorgica]MBF6094557.1 response regulator transcription factor [Nocardia cyriacigeorgica]MBF6101951.1 response regulator transcription factor [Nocardia cyriacigeorgica]MBF6158805.1 response regulator transcription factor [Nocardia cyriacigeorgica]
MTTAATETTIAVLVVDDQELVRGGLRRILRRRDGFVITECADGDEVVPVISAARPDVILMDLRMKRVGGIEATRLVRMRADAPPVLVLTTFDDDQLLSGALRAGAAGFILKDSPAEDLIRAVRTVAGGGAWLDPAVTGRVLSAYRTVRPATPTDARLAELTAREYEVLELIGRGRVNSEIARELGISEVTVKSHVGHIFGKLDLRDRAAAIVFAFDHGVVSPGQSTV